MQITKGVDKNLEKFPMPLFPRDFRVGGGMRDRGGARPASFEKIPRATPKRHGARDRISVNPPPARRGRRRLENHMEGPAAGSVQDQGRDHARPTYKKRP